MREFLKILGIILGIFIVILFFSYQFFFTKINFDENIKNNQRIKNLDKKVFWSFRLEQIKKPKKISTDFTLDGKQNDTINFTFHASQSEAGQHLPNLLFTEHYRKFFLFFNFLKT